MLLFGCCVLRVPHYQHLYQIRPNSQQEHAQPTSLAQHCPSFGFLTDSTVKAIIEFNNHKMKKDGSLVASQRASAAATVVEAAPSVHYLRRRGILGPLFCQRRSVGRLVSGVTGYCSEICLGLVFIQTKHTS